PDRVCGRTDDVTIELDWRAPSPAPPPAPPGAPPAAPPASTEPEQAPDADPGMRYVCAPSVGTFYQAHEPGAPPFVTVGSTVTAGQQVGIVEVMKLMIPVERSEEHTSELQSRENLVCRLLLEKKKKKH